jgi:MFS family permease
VTLAATPSTTERASIFSPAYRSITLSTLTLVALAAFDGMAVAAALPRIGADLGVGLLPWVLTSFALTSTVAMVAAGPLIDAYGVRAVYRVTLVVFFVSSAFCTVAPTMPVLIVARALQGIAGGTVMAVTIANVGWSYPNELRSRAFAANSSVWGVMAIAGPAVAAFVLTAVSWRGVFFVNLPLVLFAASVGWRRIPHGEPSGDLDFDVRGLTLIAVLTVALLLSLSTLSTWSVLGVAVAAVAAVVYWRHSGRREQPVLARRHFAQWPFGFLNAVPFAFFAGSLALDAYIPLFVQGGLGRSSATAAFAVAFLALGWTTGSQIVSRALDRIRNVDAMVAGFVVTLPALAVGVAVYSADTPVAVVMLLSFLQGLGIGAVTNATLSLLQATATTAEMGRASAAHQFMRQLGGTIGTAAAGAVLLGVVSSRIGSVEPVRRLLDGEDALVSEPVRAAVAAGFRGAAIVAVSLTGIGLLVALYIHRRADQIRA